MKVKKDTALFSVLHGSHLYGTATESSDFDYKTVCLPTIDDLLLNVKVTNRKQKPEGVRDQDKMIAGEIETEFLPVQVFLNDFFDGQTYALEVAFAAYKVFKSNTPFCPTDVFSLNQDLTYNYCAHVSDMIIDLVELYLTRNVKKMVGYAVAQSKQYGLKNERYTSISKALRALNVWGQKHVNVNEQRELLTLKDCPSLLEEFLKLDYVKLIEIFNGDGGTTLVPAIEICGKQFPLTNRVSTIVKSLEKTVENYGHRVKEFEDQGVDWKALSHAIRITEQILELCETGSLEFPRPNAAFLLDVKNGKLTLDVATNYLNAAFTRVDLAVTTSALQERTPALEAKFKEWKISTLRDFYSVN